MSDDIPLISVAGNTPEAAEMMDLVGLWLHVFGQFEREKTGAPEISPQRYSMAMTGAAVMSGIMFGQSIVLGLATTQDRRRAVETFAKNFRTGIDIGIRQGTRIMRETASGQA